MATLPTPTFSPVQAGYSAPQSVTFTSAGATFFFYTTDGTTPTETGGTAGGTSIKVAAGTPVVVNVTETVKVIAYDGTSADDSAVASALYTLTVPTCVPSPGTGFYAGTQSVGITNTQHALTGFQIYYTVDGSTPDNTKTAYTYGSTIPVAAGLVLKAIAYATGWTTSGVVAATYNILAISAISPASVVFDQTGQTLQLTGGVVTGGSTNVTDWSSSNSSVVTVSATGFLTAVASGVAQIKATADELNTLSTSISVAIGAVVPADITHLQSFIVRAIQSVSSANPFEAAQQKALQTALTDLQNNSLTVADLEILQSLINDQVQYLGTANPFTKTEQAAYTALLADIRSLI